MNFLDLDSKTVVSVIENLKGGDFSIDEELTHSVNRFMQCLDKLKKDLGYNNKVSTVNQEKYTRTAAALKIPPISPEDDDENLLEEEAPAEDSVEDPGDLGALDDTLGEIEGLGNAELGEPTSGIEVSPENKSKIDDILDDLNAKVDGLKSDINDKVLDSKINDIKNYLTDEIDKQIKFIQKDLEDLKEKKVPERREFETEGAYRENLYTIACYVLDEVLPDLFEDIPEYNLLASQISRNFEDGTVSDAMISVNVRVTKNDYQYDFKVDVPILNGIAQAPLYLQRGLKIVALTKDAIDKELESVSFKKVPIEDLSNKENMFNHIGDKNRFKRFDKQKQYPIDNQRVNEVGMPPSPRFTINKDTKV